MRSLENVNIDEPPRQLLSADVTSLAHPGFLPVPAVSAHTTGLDILRCTDAHRALPSQEPTRCDTIVRVLPLQIKDLSPHIFPHA